MKQPLSFKPTVYTDGCAIDRVLTRDLALSPADKSRATHRDKVYLFLFSAEVTDIRVTEAEAIRTTFACCCSILTAQ